MIPILGSIALLVGFVAGLYYVSRWLGPSDDYLYDKDESVDAARQHLADTIRRRGSQ